LVGRDESNELNPKKRRCPQPLLQVPHGQNPSEKVNPLFGDAHTHTTAAGAGLNGQCVIAGLKALPDDPLAPFLKEEKTIASFSD